MQTKRILRVREQLQRVISQIVQSLKDPRIGFLTITDVIISPDLRQARVYYSVLGDLEARNDTSLVLEHALPYIRREVGLRIDLRRVPELEFVYDQTSEHAQKVYKILHYIEKERVKKGDKKK